MSNFHLTKFVEEPELNQLSGQWHYSSNVSGCKDKDWKICGKFYISVKVTFRLEIKSWT